MLHQMRYWPVLLVLTITACAPSPSDKIMDQIEANVRMPAGASSLASYRRYYYRDDQAVIGTYVLSSNPGREWRTKDKMVLLLDGGCGVVNVVFSTNENRVTYTDCNGVA